MTTQYTDHTNFTGDPDSTLSPLKDLKNFKVAKDNFDVRGWEVYGADGRKLGVVDDLIVDESLMKVRYLDVDIDNDLIHDNPDHHLLVPIGSARLQSDGDKVYVNHLDQMTLPRYPLYAGGAVVPEYERLLRETMINPDKTPVASEQATTPIPADFYKHEYFDERKFYDRPADTSSANISSNPVHHDLDALERLIKMRDSGVLTEEEFQHLKRRAIGI
jgi:sporulation protein YlmC with PRC-barrel domain